MERAQCIPLNEVQPEKFLLFDLPCLSSKPNRCLANVLDSDREIGRVQQKKCQPPTYNTIFGIRTIRLRVCVFVCYAALRVGQMKRIFN